MFIAVLDCLPSGMKQIAGCLKRAILCLADKRVDQPADAFMHVQDVILANNGWLNEITDIPKKVRISKLLDEMKKDNFKNHLSFCMKQSGD